MEKLQLEELGRDKVMLTVLKIVWTRYSDATASWSELGAVRSQTRGFNGCWVAFYMALEGNGMPSEEWSKGGVARPCGDPAAELGLPAQQKINC